MSQIAGLATATSEIRLCVSSPKTHLQNEIKVKCDIDWLLIFHLIKAQRLI